MTRKQVILASALTLSIGLTACATDGPGPFVPVAVKPQIEDAPAWMRRPCPRLLELPNNATKAQQQEAWLADTKEYEKCRIRQAALVNYMEGRDSGLTGEPRSKQVPKKKAKKKASLPAVTKPAPPPIVKIEPKPDPELNPPVNPLPTPVMPPNPGTRPLPKLTPSGEAK